MKFWVILSYTSDLFQVMFSLALSLWLRSLFMFAHTVVYVPVKICFQLDLLLLGTVELQRIAQFIVKVVSDDEFSLQQVEGTEFKLNNDLKTLAFYSIEDGDQVLVRWS